MESPCQPHARFCVTVFLVEVEQHKTIRICGGDIPAFPNQDLGKIREAV